VSRTVLSQGRIGCFGSMCGLESQGLGGRHKTIRHERAPVARKLADDRGLPSIVRLHVPPVGGVAMPGRPLQPAVIHSGGTANAPGASWRFSLLEDEEAT
jgi:hypothetical protein